MRRAPDKRARPAVIWSPDLGVLAVAAAGDLCAFPCVVDALPGECSRRRSGTNPLVDAAFRTKRLLREPYSATYQRRRCPGQARHRYRQGGLQITAFFAHGYCSFPHAGAAAYSDVRLEWVESPIVKVRNGPTCASIGWSSDAGGRAAGSTSSREPRAFHGIRYRAGGVCPNDRDCDFRPVGLFWRVAPCSRASW